MTAREKTAGGGPRLRLAMIVLACVACAGASKPTTGAGNGDGPVRASAPPRPNVIVIMFDDLGYSDLGAFGGEIETPNIDRLAADGVRFTQFYNASRCSPSRASLLTGLYPHRVGLGRNGSSMTYDGVTVAEVLRKEGYATAMVGKWHLTRATPLPEREEHLKWLNHQAYLERPFGDLETYPAARGFERYYGPIWGVVDYFDPFSLVENFENVREVRSDYYITDALTEKSIAYIEAMAQSGKPFFLYLAHTAPHWPIHARAEDKAKYDGVYDQGWRALRATRYARQVGMSLIEEGAGLLPTLTRNAADEPGGAFNPEWDSLTAAEKAYHADKMEAHAAMVDRADQGIGKILGVLESKGLLENTVIMILSDNGASPEVVQRPGYDRPSELRDGTRITYGDHDTSLDPGHETVITGIGPSWASAANTPWRYWKREPYDGGTHTPLILYWPKGLSGRKGAFVKVRGHVMDIAPTIYDIVGATYPGTYKGRSLQPLDGVSLVPALGPSGKGGQRSLFFEHEKGRAVISGRWKLLSMASRNGYKPWRLYNLEKDRMETNDVSSSHPEVVTTLAHQWHQWADDVGVLAPEN